METYLVPIIGDGTPDDPFRAAVVDIMSHQAYIPTDKDGYPLNSQALVLVSEPDALKIPDWMSAEPVPLDQVQATMSTLDNALL